MASGALAPWFPAVEIGSEYYWDGGVISNTPLEWLARQRLPDTLAFQVDLWAAPGELPKNVPEVMTRMKEILNSSRTTYRTGGTRRLIICTPPSSNSLDRFLRSSSGARTRST